MVYYLLKIEVYFEEKNTDIKIPGLEIDNFATEFNYLNIFDKNKCNQNLYFHFARITLFLRDLSIYLNLFQVS